MLPSKALCRSIPEILGKPAIFVFRSILLLLGLDLAFNIWKSVCLRLTHPLMCLYMFSFARAMSTVVLQSRIFLTTNKLLALQDYKTLPFPFAMLCWHFSRKCASEFIQNAKFIVIDTHLHLNVIRPRGTEVYK